jgi:hypothetical protein
LEPSGEPTYAPTKRFDVKLFVSHNMSYLVVGLVVVAWVVFFIVRYAPCCKSCVGDDDDDRPIAKPVSSGANDGSASPQHAGAVPRARGLLRRRARRVERLLPRPRHPRLGGSLRRRLRRRARVQLRHLREQCMRHELAPVRGGNSYSGCKKGDDCPMLHVEDED